MYINTLGLVKLRPLTHGKRRKCGEFRLGYDVTVPA